MALNGTKTFVGFGFGAIQSGLFLYEAFQSGNFKRLVVAEIISDTVDAIREADNFYYVNIAYDDCVETSQVGPIEILNPTIDSDRERLIEAVANANEIATAVPSVRFYASEKESSLHRIIAAGLYKKIKENKPRVVIYAAENHNHAAEILQELVMDELPEETHQLIHSRVKFLNSVIGKMSQVVNDPEEIALRGLIPIALDTQRAFLVESFNRILISKIDFEEPFHRGITSLSEKTDLLPFEEAKLYGHNATHALAGYMGLLYNVQFIFDLQKIPGVVNFLRNAFITESGAALIRKYNQIDSLFTRDGYENYADDLLKRMFNPFLLDSVDRVTRDTERKLGWNDRLIGTMRLAIENKIQPHRYALGVVAAVSSLMPSEQGISSIDKYLISIWGDSANDPAEVSKVLSIIEQAWILLNKWRDEGFPDPENYITTHAWEEKHGKVKS